MEELNVIFSIGLVVLLALLLVYWLFAPIITAPFFVSSSKDLLAMFSLVDLKRKDRLIDLGSGDGRAVLAASRVCEFAQGVEINPFLTLFSRFMAIMSANGKIKFINKNFLDVEIKEFNVVFIYLSPKYLNKLKIKLEKELKPGTRVVTNKFKIKGWKEEKNQDSKYFLYVIGKHKKNGSKNK